MVMFPKYGFRLQGWDLRSVWGWDPAADSYYAQLTSDTSRQREDWEGPEVWVSPPRWGCTCGAR
jgi:hypothetical protein